jgi:hypothetical protein
VTIFPLDGKATELSGAVDPIIPSSGFTDARTSEGAFHLRVVHRHRIRPCSAYNSSQCSRSAKAPSRRTLRHRTLGIRPSSYLRLGSSGLEDGGGNLTKLGFANRLDDDACMSVAILKGFWTHREADVGGRLGEFTNETEGAPSPVRRVFTGHSNLVAVGGGVSSFQCPFIQQNRTPQRGEPDPPGPAEV